MKKSYTWTLAAGTSAAAAAAARKTTKTRLIDIPPVVDHCMDEQTGYEAAEEVLSTTFEHANVSFSRGKPIDPLLKSARSHREKDMTLMVKSTTTTTTSTFTSMQPKLNSGMHTPKGIFCLFLTDELHRDVACLWGIFPTIN